MATFSSELRQCKTVVWNGPMGVFEFEKFAKGELPRFSRVHTHTHTNTRTQTHTPSHHHIIKVHSAWPTRSRRQLTQVRLPSLAAAIVLLQWNRPVLARKCRTFPRAAELRSSFSRARSSLALPHSPTSEASWARSSGGNAASEKGAKGRARPGVGYTPILRSHIPGFASH